VSLMSSVFTATTARPPWPCAMPLVVLSADNSWAPAGAPFSQAYWVALHEPWRTPLIARRAPDHHSVTRFSWKSAGGHRSRGRCTPRASDWGNLLDDLLVGPSAVRAGGRSAVNSDRQRPRYWKQFVGLMP
jgi:hypothetical protein